MMRVIIILFIWNKYYIIRQKKREIVHRYVKDFPKYITQDLHKHSQFQK